jgi:hypothetical protein
LGGLTKGVKVEHRSDLGIRKFLDGLKIGSMDFTLSYCGVK